jgi:hypothetical protein
MKMYKVAWKELWLLTTRRLSERCNGVKPMTKRQENARQNLVAIVGYFEMVAEAWNWHFWRKSEYEIAFKVANLISAKDTYSRADFEEIATCINALAGQAHANGSGWLDFQIRVNTFFSAFRYESKWDDATGVFSFR